MTRILRCASAVVLLCAVLWGTAAAEIVFSVNDSNTGVFDQPAATFEGNTVYVAYIGDDTGSGTFRVFFAAVNGATDFSNLLLPVPRDATVLPIGPVAIDNTGAAGDAYFDARHPRIALRSATEAVILFQARPTPADVAYRPYIARLSVAAASATLLSVRRVTGFPAGDLSTGTIEDIAFRLVPADNTVRMAFANRAAGAGTPFHVYFARVGIEDAGVAGTPLLLSSGNDDTLTGSDGFRPVPALRLDPSNNAHVVWAANDSAPTPSGIYYALVTTSATIDNVAIAATEVLGRTLAWGHPSVSILATNSVVVMGADESFPGRAGSMGFVNLNPDAVVPRTGRPVSISQARLFLVFGPSILPPVFDLYHPEAFADVNSQIHLTGYGASGTTSTYYAVKATAVSPFADFVTPPISIGFNEFPAELPGDYTKAAFGVLNAKTVVFWSALIPGSVNRDLNFTSVPNNSFIAEKESGCSMIREPLGGKTRGIQGALLLLLPAAALAVLRVVRRSRRPPRRNVAD